MEKELIKLMRAYTTKLVRIGTATRRCEDIMRYLRPDENDGNYIIVEADKGYYDNNARCWKKDLQEERIAVKDVEPCIKIRFITPDYITLFEATDFDMVEFDTYSFDRSAGYIKSGTELRRVIADDCGTDDLSAYHFHFENGECYHICEFAEKVNPNGDRVRLKGTNIIR
jgi:hypothetical protein